MLTLRPDGTQLNGWSVTGDLSDHGRFLVFSSGATNLDPADGDEIMDTYVKDRKTGATELISLGIDGKPDNVAFPFQHYPYPRISGDGRFVAYDTPSTNQVAGDTNGESDVFVHDRTTGETFLASGRPDGRPGNGASTRPSISRDGRYVAFMSSASNLVADDGDHKPDVFLFDTTTRTTKLLSQTAAGVAIGGSYPMLSDSGKQVVFTARPELLGLPPAAVDVIVRLNRTSGALSLVSASTTGDMPNDSSSEASISGNGRFAAYTSWATNLVAGDNPADGDSDIYLTDLRSGRTVLASPSSHGSTGPSRHPLISNDGETVAFTSYNYIVDGTRPDDERIDDGDSELTFAYDRATASVTLVSRQWDGPYPRYDCPAVAVSGDGRFVAFATLYPYIVPDDENGTWDIFSRRLS